MAPAPCAERSCQKKCAFQSAADEQTQDGEPRPVCGKAGFYQRLRQRLDHENKGPEQNSGGYAGRDGTKPGCEMNGVRCHRTLYGRHYSSLQGGRFLTATEEIHQDKSAAQSR